MLVWVNMGMAANATGSGCYPCSCQSWAVESIAAGLCTVCIIMCVCVVQVWKMKEKMITG
jgi:hypothetical protein